MTRLRWFLAMMGVAAASHTVPLPATELAPWWHYNVCKGTGYLTEILKPPPMAHISEIGTISYEELDVLHRKCMAGVDEPDIIWVRSGIFPESIFQPDPSKRLATNKKG